MLSTFRSVDRLRLVSTGVLAAVLVMLSVFAGQRTLSGRLADAQDARRSTEEELAALVTLWRSHVEQSVASWIKDLPFEEAPGQVERRRRAAVPWFDASLLLAPTAGGGWAVAWPTASPHEDATAVLAAPCVAAAAALQTRGQAAAAAEAFGRCAGPDLPTQLYARVQAARLYLSMSDPDLALAALEDGQLPLRMPLSEGVARGLDLRRLAQRLELAADAHEALREESEATALRLLLVDEVLSLPGPQVQELLPVAERLLSRDVGAPIARAREPALRRARRRVEAFAAVRGQAEVLGAAAQVGVLQVKHAAGPFPAWALAWSAVPPADGAAGPAHVAVIVLDSEALFEPVVRSAAGGSGGRYVIVDRDHNVVFGDGSVIDRTAHVEAEVGVLYPQLHLASEGGASAPIAVAEDLATLLAPMVAALLLSGAAVSVQLTADRRARELSERQDAFIARVTHELKTPLAGIRVMAETLELGAAEDPATRGRFLGKILEECDNLGARIDEVLAAARRPELGGTRLQPLDELARSVVAQWTARFAARGAELRADLRPTAAIEVDQHLLKDALGNLLDNALKYGKTGVKLRCEVRTYQHGSWAVIEVSDNGIGVPPHMRRRIFERFVRVEGPGRGKAGGHGLGLAFVAEAAAAHRGLVECGEGTEGGARFRLRLRDPRAAGLRGLLSRIAARRPTPRA